MGNWKSETTFENVKPGTYPARCVKIVDIGTQHGEYQGKPTVRRKNVITWELPDELRDDGKPMIISKFYTTSLGEKATLRRDLVNWRGREFTAAELRDFDPKNILGKPCLITVTEKENGKTAVSGVSGLPKGMPVAEQINPSFYFDLDDFSQDLYDQLSEGMKKLIRGSAEFPSLGIVETDGEQNGTPEHSGTQPNETTFGDHVQAADDDDIPF